MSESELAARLAAHENAFESLLDLIPAKFYNPEDTANQWNKRKQTKEEAVQAKRSKLDPDQAARRPNKPATKIESPQNAKRDVKRKDKKSQTQQGSRPVAGAQKGLKQTNTKQAKALQTNSNDENSLPTTNGSPTDHDSNAAGNTENESNGNATASTPTAAAERNITDLRARLAAKIAALQSKRKAPGSGVEGAPNSRAAILEARRKKEEARKEKRRLEREAKRDAPDDKEEDGSASHDDSQSDTSDSDEEDSLMFGKVAFSDGQQLSADGTVKGSRKRKQQDTKSALQAAIAKKARLAALPQDKQAKIAESDAWHKVLLQADGQKVKDDVNLLKKAAKRETSTKKKSTQEWKERLATIAKQKAFKQKNREQNLKDRRESKGKAGGHKKGKQIGAYQGKKKANGKSGKGGF